MGLPQDGDFNESILKYFIAGFISSTYKVEVFKEIVQGSCRADLYVPLLNLIIECKLESSRWTLTHINTQRDNYYNNFGDVNICFVSPGGKYGITLEDLPEYIENLLTRLS